MSLRTITVKLPPWMLVAIDELVKAGKFTCRSEVIRAALKKFLDEELAKLEEERKKGLVVSTPKLVIKEVSLED